MSKVDAETMIKAAWAVNVPGLASAIRKGAVDPNGWVFDMARLLLEWERAETSEEEMLAAWDKAIESHVPKFSPAGPRLEPRLPPPDLSKLKGLVAGISIPKV